MIRRIVGLTRHPSDTFREIVREPRFLTPWLLSCAFFVTPMLVAVHRIGITRLLGNLKELEGFEDSVTLLFQFLVVATPIIAIPATALCLIPMIAAMGSTAKLRPLLAVTSYATLLPAAGVCVAAFFVLLRDPAKLSLESLAPFNLGVLVPATFNSVLHNIASTIELFSAWSVLLLSHGVAAASGLAFRRVFLALALPLILVAWVLAALAAVL
jgi:hypothetical protein